MEVSEELSSDTILQWLDPVTDTDSLLAAVRDIYESTWRSLRSSLVTLYCSGWTL